MTLAAVLLASAAPAARATIKWTGPDKKHIGVVLNYQRRQQVPRPTVYLLGGSTARESTISDRAWRRQIRGMGGPKVLAFNLGSTNQTFVDNINMVAALPDSPALIVVGVNLSRWAQVGYVPYGFTATTQALTLAQVDDYPQHRFDGHYISTDAKKRRMVERWLKVRYPVFKRVFAAESGHLRELVALCQSRGFKVVILNLPFNRKIAGHRLDAPLARCRSLCRDVAAACGVPYIDFVSEVSLASSDYADLSHLVPSGRVKWQRRLTRMTVYWLKRYGIPAPAQTPTPTPTPTPTETPTPTPTPTPTETPASPATAASGVTTHSTPPSRHRARKENPFRDDR